MAPPPASCRAAKACIPVKHRPSNPVKPSQVFCLPHFPRFSLAPLGASWRITVSLKNRIPLKDYRLPPYSGWEMWSSLIGFGSGPLSKEWGREYPLITECEMIRKPSFIWGFVYNLAPYSKMFPQAGGQQGRCPS